MALLWPFLMGMAPPPDETLLRADQVAQRLGVTAQHVRRLWREGKLLGVKLSFRRLMFRPEDVQEYLKSINKIE